MNDHVFIYKIEALLGYHSLPEIPNIIGSIASRQFRQCWVRRGPIVLRAKKLRLKLVLTDLGQGNFSLFVA